jgi:hypothetical protein
VQRKSFLEARVKAAKKLRRRRGKILKRAAAQFRLAMELCGNEEEARALVPAVWDAIRREEKTLAEIDDRLRAFRR